MSLEFTLEVAYDHFKAGKKSDTLNHMDIAAYLFERVMKESNPDAYLYNDYGFALNCLGRFEEAITSFSYV